MWTIFPSKPSGIYKHRTGSRVARQGCRSDRSNQIFFFFLSFFFGGGGGGFLDDIRIWHLPATFGHWSYCSGHLDKRQKKNATTTIDDRSVSETRRAEQNHTRPPPTRIEKFPDCVYTSKLLDFECCWSGTIKKQVKLCTRRCSAKAQTTSLEICEGALKPCLSISREDCKASPSGMTTGHREGETLRTYTASARADRCSWMSNKRKPSAPTCFLPVRAGVEPIHHVLHERNRNETEEKKESNHVTNHRSCSDKPRQGSDFVEQLDTATWKKKHAEEIEQVTPRWNMCTITPKAIPFQHQRFDNRSGEVSCRRETSSWRPRALNH